MATLSRCKSRSLYSWWWDSHNSPKNSKWLQDNLTDIDAKVKSMIKLIEEDADSFARRAEMYYKKRPELMKLVEEFYRAYRALAERYSHATGELCHAHRALAKAYPDQIPPELVQDSPSKSLAFGLESHTPEMRYLAFDRDDLPEDGNSSESESLDIKKNAPCKEDHPEGSFDDKVIQLSNENQNLREKVFEESERAGKAESEVGGLKQSLADMQAELENVVVQYQLCMSKLSDVEGQLNNAQKDLTRINENANRAAIEVQTLQEALIQLEAEKNAGLVKQKEYLEKISSFEDMLSQAEEVTKVLNSREIEAQREAQSLKEEISRLQLEKGKVLHQYNECVGKASALEDVISGKENEVIMIKKHSEKVEEEISELKKSLANLTMQKEASAIQYKCCLERISKLEEDLSISKEDMKRLSNEILIGNLKQKNAEDKYNLLEISNRSLKNEAENLAKKITVKDQELSDKQKELESLQSCLQAEHLHRSQIESTLETLKILHSQSQEDQKALGTELKNMLQMLKDLEISKHGLEEEVQRARDEKERLCEANLSSAISMENMQSEILSLGQIKLRFEKEVSHHIGLSDSFQQEILYLKEEIKGLNTSYLALVEQVEAEGLTPVCLGSAIKSLKDENSLLKKNYDQSSKEKEVLCKKLENMQEIIEKNVIAESSLSDLNTELEKSQNMMNAVQKSSQFLHGEKNALVTEKASLLSQLQVMTKNMHRLLEKNAVLENFLSTAKVELEVLREKSKGLEEICELLKNERSYLLSERERLVLQLEKVERRLESAEKQCTGLERRYADLEMEKEAMHLKVQKLEFSLSTEKQERTSSHSLSEMRMAGLERQILDLDEENTWKQKQCEDGLEKSLKAQFELSVLQKFMKDMEEKNYSLIVECQKHVEASKLAEKLISELESESLEQQVETELLLDEIEQLRFGIHEIFRALKNGPDRAPEEKIKNEETFVHHIVGIIEDMKCSLLDHEDNKQLCLVENSILLTLLEQLESKGREMESHKTCIEKELKNMAKKFSMVKVEKDKLLELNKKLKSKVAESREHAAILEAETEGLCIKQDDLLEAYEELDERCSRLNQDNKNLLKKFSELKDEKFRIDQYMDEVLLEHLSTANQSAIFGSFIKEKLADVNLLLEDLNRQRNANCGLEREMCILTEKLELQKAQNLTLQDTIRKLENETQRIREYTVQLKKDIQSGQDRLLHKEPKLLIAEMKLQAAETLNLKLNQTVDELKIDIEESVQIGETLQKNVLQLSENNSIQEEEIEVLHTTNTDLKSELGLLHEEINKKTIREKALISELQEKSSMLESWEADATAFYFNLQMSSFNEILYRKKIQELTDVCSDLEKENISKTSEIELMEGKIYLLESQISKLQSRLHAAPVIAAIEDDATSLEDNETLRTKLKWSQNQELEILEDAMDSSSSTSEIHAEEKSLVSLQNLQTRFKAVGKMIEEMNKPAVLHRKSDYLVKLDLPTNEIEQLKVRRLLNRDKHDHSRKKGHGSDCTSPPKLQNKKTKASTVYSGIRIKDIPLDQVTDSKRSHIGLDDEMLELWETAEDSKRELTIGESLRMAYKMSEKDIRHDQLEKMKTNPESPIGLALETQLSIDKLELSSIITEPTRDMNSRRILERLASDAKKLENLHLTLENLGMKLRSCKKSKHAKNFDFETVQEQLQEAEETVLQLVLLNGQLVKNTEECPSPGGKTLTDKDVVKTQKRNITEQARKGSERIGRLQLELQKIQYILLKMEDEKKNIAKSKFFRSKTIILRDFIYNGRKNSGKRKKSPACGGCFRSSTSRNGRQG